MRDNSEHKKKFIEAELKWYDEYLREALRKNLLQKKIGITNELLGSLTGKVKAANDNSEGEFDLSFLTRGRFVDMGAGRGYHKGIKSLTTRKEHIYSLTARKEKLKRKPNKWYSKVAYGTLDRLAMRLVSNYEEEIINSVKSAEA